MTQGLQFSVYRETNPKRRIKLSLSLSLCLAQSQAEAHYRGSRHAKKLKSQENKARAKLSITGESGGSSTSPAGPAPPVPANSTNQHSGWFYLLVTLIMFLLCGVCLFFYDRVF